VIGEKWYLRDAMPRLASAQAAAGICASRALL
jgi:hypothetical protein